MGAISMRASKLVLSGLLAAFAARRASRRRAPARPRRTSRWSPKRRTSSSWPTSRACATRPCGASCSTCATATRRPRRTTTSSSPSAALDPFKQIDSVFVAFPQSGGEQQGVRGHPARQVRRAQARRVRQGAGQEGRPRRHHHRLQRQEALHRQPEGRGVGHLPRQQDGRRRRQGVGARRSSISPPARARAPRRTTSSSALLKRAKTSRRALGRRHGAAVDARLVQERSAPVVGGVDEGHLRLGRLRVGRAAEINVDTGSEADAKDLTAKATAQLADVKKSPQFMMMGLAQFLDGVKIEQQGRHLPPDVRATTSSRSTTSSTGSRACSRASAARWAAVCRSAAEPVARKDSRSETTMATKKSPLARSKDEHGPRRSWSTA